MFVHRAAPEVDGSLDEKSGSFYYYDRATGKTQWEHPLDHVYRSKVKEYRAKKQSGASICEPTDDATYAKDDIPSFEEAPLQPKKLQPLLPLNKPSSARKLRKSPTVDLKVSPRYETTLVKQKSEELTSKKHLSIDSSFDVEADLGITGGGVSFLKLDGSGSEDNADQERIPDKPYSLDLIGNWELDNDDEKKEATVSKSSSDNDDSSKKNANPILQVLLAPRQRSESPFKMAIQNEPVRDKPPLPKRNLKLIKPNPTDFIKPVLMRTKCSDSDDDSSNRTKKLMMEDIDVDSDNSLDSPDENYRRLERTMERRVEKLKSKIWKSKNEDLLKFQENLEESHKKEIKRITDKKKESFELKLEEQLQQLKTDFENKSKKILEEEKEMLQDKMEILKDELNAAFIKEKQLLQEQFDLKKDELEKYYEEKLVDIENTLAENVEKHRDELMLNHNSTLEELKQNNAIIIDQLKKDFILEEERIKCEHRTKIEELMNALPKEAESDNKYDEKYEKIKCDKRLLQDKYKCLKEKYIKLKNDVKTTMEKRNNKKKENGKTTNTGSETEKTVSTPRERLSLDSPSRRSFDKPPVPNFSRSKGNDCDTSISDRSDKADTSDNNSTSQGRSRGKTRSKLKRTQRTCSPVENLRRQLQKLEDLEDQFPQQPPDTYHLRYPFSDGQKFEGSSELEFFRHRIHLERDSIKRAKESLRSQKAMFQQKQKELKLKHGTMARHTYQQLCQEEKEMTDMEVSLHRTRGLLGEKSIRLRHLEQSLRRATVANEPNYDDATLSDISSHSASSGISSTEFATTDVHLARNHVGDMEEPSEIVQSLESLTSEIREIWEVLRKQEQQSGSITAVLPPFVYPDLGWPLVAACSSPALSAPPSIPTLADRLNSYRQHVALVNAQGTVVTHAGNQGATTSLVERNRNLRQWLKQAGIENGGESSNAQANL